MRFLVPIIAFLALIVALILGWGRSFWTRSDLLKTEPATAVERLELKVLGFTSETMNPVIPESALRHFMEQYPGISVVCEGIRENEYWPALMKRARTGYLDDVIMIDHGHLLRLTENHRLANLDYLANSLSMRTKVREQFMEPGGAVYFLPLSLSASGIFVNEDLLRARGLSVPATTTELRRICEIFAAENIIPFAVSGADALASLAAARSLYPLIREQNAARVAESFNSGRASLARNMRPGLALAAEFIARGWIQPQEIRRKPGTSALQAFARGERPFLLDGARSAVPLERLKPAFQWKIHPLPVLEDGPVLITSLTTCLSLNAASRRLPQARAFLDYLMQDEVLWNCSEGQNGIVPLSRGRAPSRPAMIPLMKSLTLGRFVMYPDFRLTVPLESSLREACLDLTRFGLDETLRRLAQNLADARRERRFGDE